jgi:hypothetical protein
MQIQSNTPVIPQQTAPSVQQAGSKAAAPAENTSQLKNDVLHIDLKRVGKGALGLAGGAGAGILGGAVTSGAAAIVLERGIPANIGGYVAAGGLLVGGMGGAAGAITSTLLTNNPKTGALVGGAAGAVTGAAYLGKTLGNTNAAILGGVVGGVAGAIGGYTSAKIRD